ncbi:Acetyltransferase (GNAT) family protein [compost metagenome]
MRETIQEGNAFVIKEDGSVIAEVTFKPVGEGTIVIDHTYVAEEMRGQKLAEDLVRRVVEHARETNQKIIPACSYADAQFRRRKEYEDVWQKS